MYYPTFSSERPWPGALGQPCSRRNSGFTATSAPFAACSGAENDVCSLNNKAIQKPKEAVLREIEFEDGKIAWVDFGPRQIAGHPLIDELLGDDNTDRFWDHVIVLDDELLLDFLMTGAELY
jgi:hypothetical protein